MVWTTQKPKRQGWYWFRESHEYEPIAVEVRKWRLDAHLRESLCMFYRPANPEETGVFLLDDVSAGEWLGPINPGDRYQEPVVVERVVERAAEPVVIEKIVEVPSEPIVVEKVVEKIVEKPVPSEPSKPDSEVPRKENPAHARVILEWFISVGTDHFPKDVQGEYVVALANMLADSLRLGRKFDGVTDVVKFLMENGDH